MLHLWETIQKKFAKDQNHHCLYAGNYKGAGHSICNLIFNVPIQVLVVFHNGSNCYYHFIIKQLAKELEGQFECLEENSEKYKSFSIPIEKEI